jgi:hypothetical protein
VISNQCDRDLFDDSWSTLRQGNLGDLLDIVTEALREVLHAEDAFVFIVDSPRKEM